MAFEQQPKESDEAFAAFNLYLSQGPERSLAKTAAKLSRSKVLMEKWSSKFDWPARVSAYNAHMALVEREAAEAITRAKGVSRCERGEMKRPCQQKDAGERGRLGCPIRQTAALAKCRQPLIQSRIPGPSIRPGRHAVHILDSDAACLPFPVSSGWVIRCRCGGATVWFPWGSAPMGTTP